MSEHATPHGKPRLTRPQMAERLAAEFQDGWIVNLGTGMPLMCSDFVVPGRTVIFHAENGVIGYGRRAVTEDEASPHLVNAGGGAVVLEPFASFIHHADSFAIVRKGLLNTSVLGAYEVGADGGLANWKVAGALGGGIGGAMDIAACAQQVFAILEHTQRNGEPRLLPKCTLPLTAPPCVTLVMTDLGLFRANGAGFEALELAPGWTLDEVAALTGAPLTASANLGVVEVGRAPSS
jgi:3-oxoacid CoA-transferase B subunit